MTNILFSLIPSYDLLIYAVCISAWALVLIPPVHYLSTLWRVRRDALLELMKENSILLYFRQFHPAEKVDRGTARQAFNRFFHERYGRQHYALAYMVLFGLTTLATYSAIDALTGWVHGTPVRKETLLVAAALAGAYFFVIQDQLSQIRKLDLTRDDLSNYGLRILVAVPFGWAISQFANPEFGTPIAFLLGAFPTRAIFSMAKRLTSQKLNLADETGDDPQKRRAELEHLQSIGKPAAERFALENISSIVDLAYEDPIDLAMRTNFDFKYIIDCVSQALLWIYLEDSIHDKGLYQLSLRGAQEAETLHRDNETYHEIVEKFKKHQGPPPDELTERKHSDGEHAIEDIASRLGMCKDSFMVTLRRVALDPHTEFLCTLWEQMKPKIKEGEQYHVQAVAKAQEHGDIHTTPAA